MDPTAKEKTHETPQGFLQGHFVFRPQLKKCNRGFGRDSVFCSVLFCSAHGGYELFLYNPSGSQLNVHDDRCCILFNKTNTPSGHQPLMDKLSLAFWRNPAVKINLFFGFKPQK